MSSSSSLQQEAMVTSSAKAKADTTHNWELFKENAAPLERGRNANLLSKVLSSPTAESTQVKKDNDRNIHHYEALIRPSEKFAKYYLKLEDEQKMKKIKKKKYGISAASSSRHSRNGEDDYDEFDNDDDDSDSKIDVDALLIKCKVDQDPIIHWLKYIKYHEETYPSDTHAQFLLMERCTHSLFHISKYTNDVRFIRVCILYAEKTSNPHDQFKLYHKCKLGEKVAIFWLAWAWIAEKRKDFPFADKLFRKAKQKQAKPSKIIDERYKQFQRRMSRYWLNNAEKEQQEREGHSMQQGLVYGFDHDGENEYDQENKRGVLNGLTEEGVRQNNRARGVNINPNHISSLGGVLSNRNGQRGNGGAAAAKHDYKNGVASSKSSFSVFMDSNTDNDNGYDLNQSSLFQDNEENQVPLPRMVREKDRRKENTTSAEAWNQRGGLHSYHNSSIIGEDDHDHRQEAAVSSVARRWAGTGSESIVAGGTSSQPAFQVFVDEECKNEENNEKNRDGTVSAGTKRPSSRSRNHDRTLRQRMDESSSHKHREALRMMRSSSDEASDNSSKDTKSISRKGLSSRGTISSSKESKSKDRDYKNNSLKMTCTSSRRNKGCATNEICYEERRARSKYYKLYSLDNNFNLLENQRVQSADEDENENEESCVEMDESSSIEEVDMEEETDDGLLALQNLKIDENEPPVVTHKQNDVLNVTIYEETKSALNTTTLHGTVSESVAKRTNPRKILFDVNASIDSKSFVSAANNASTNSSVLNETDAVGIHDREETVNTKFAARELSMMFASPGALNKSLNNSRQNKSCRKLDSDRLLFSVHRNNKKDSNDSNNSSNADLDNMLSIYCDPEESDKENKGVFKIFEEAPTGTDMKGIASIESGLKGLYESEDNSSDSDSDLRSEDRGSGDTASYSDIMALLQNTNDDNEVADKTKSKGTYKEGTKLEIYCDHPNHIQNDENKSVCYEIDNGTMLSEDEAAFGDISFIPHKDNTIDLQGRMRQMKLTDRL